MVTKTLTVRNELGIHARAAGRIVRMSKSFRSKITIEKNGMMANARSILALMMLTAVKGSRILVSAVGDDEKEALAAFENLVAVNFHED